MTPTVSIHETKFKFMFDRTIHILENGIVLGDNSCENELKSNNFMN